MARLQAHSNSVSLEKDLSARFKTNGTTEPADFKIVVNFSSYKAEETEAPKQCSVQTLALPNIGEKR